MSLKTKIAFSLSILCTFCIVALTGNAAFAQKIDSTRITLKPKPKVVSRIPQIKANIPTYKPFFGISSTNTNTSAPLKTGVKILTVLKIYPNPVNEQLNISLRLDRELMLSIKITDLLGNDVVVLANERTPAGEQTKTFNIPTKLNAGIYFLRIVAGGEQVVKKISVL